VEHRLEAYTTSRSEKPADDFGRLSFCADFPPVFSQAAKETPGFLGRLNDRRHFLS
jgi:hypothetical protein